MKLIYPTDQSLPLLPFSRLATVACVTAMLAIGCGGGGGSGRGGVVGGGESTRDKPWPTGDKQMAVSWRTPTERENGEPLPLSELKGYRIHWGPTSNPTQYSITINDPYATSFTLQGVRPGSYELAMTAIDTEGRESALSGALSRTL